MTNQCAIIYIMKQQKEMYEFVITCEKKWRKVIFGIIGVILYYIGLCISLFAIPSFIPNIVFLIFFAIGSLIVIILSVIVSVELISQRVKDITKLGILSKKRLYRSYGALVCISFTFAVISLAYLIWNMIYEAQNLSGVMGCALICSGMVFYSIFSCLIFKSYVKIKKIEIIVK